MYIVIIFLENKNVESKARKSHGRAGWSGSGRAGARARARAHRGGAAGRDGCWVKRSAMGTTYCFPDMPCMKRVYRDK